MYSSVSIVNVTEQGKNFFLILVDTCWLDVYFDAFTVSTIQCANIKTCGRTK
jgi:hypothetical protein